MTIDTDRDEGAAADCVSVIARSTEAKIGKFLFELASGTRDYRSLHNLTAQVEHQYHGRFAIELLQNAHDALSQGRSRVCMAIRDEGPHGALYVANDGKPFSRSNFDSLSQLGNSDKRPQDSIGHKGLGFRSVLEITDRPEIYSRQYPDSAAFDGYRFGFYPEFVSCLAEPVGRLCADGDSASVPVEFAALHDWSPGQLANLRQRVGQQAQAARQERLSWLQAELSYLSPYLLPRACTQAPAALAEFERDGYATVVRLPFKDPPSRELAVREIQRFDAVTLIFLDRIDRLTLDAGNGAARTLRRCAEADTHSSANGTRLVIGDGSDTQVYQLWQRTLDLRKRGDLVSALGRLPGRWAEMQCATVALAVRAGPDPDSGSLSIFLPTRLSSGCAAHVNAPFYGDISRTSIDFGDGAAGLSAAAVYNRYLVEQAANLALDVIETELAGKDVEQARMVIDLLAPAGSEPAAARWRQGLAAAAASRRRDLTALPWILSDRGWHALREVVVLPAKLPTRLLHDATLRDAACFRTLHAGLNRRDQFAALSRREGLPTEPTPVQMAATLEAFVAKSFVESSPQAAETFWADFWSDAEILLGDNGKLLKDCRVLLGNDGVLHASSGCAVFFRPRQGATEDEEVDNEQDVSDIPLTLRASVAFLSDSVPIYAISEGRQAQTSVRRYLEHCELVSRFRREQILNRVLIPQVRRLRFPLGHRAPEAELCRDIMLWGLRLAAGQVSRGGEGDRRREQLRQLPAPCVGGWYTLADAGFGRGWSRQGDALSTYLRRAATATARSARRHLLLPPGYRHWGRRGGELLETLKEARVRDCLQPIKPAGAAAVQFDADKEDFRIDVAAPPDWPAADWASYCVDAAREARPRYRWGPYQFAGIDTLPGLERFAEFDAITQRAFAEAVVDGIASWTGEWRSIAISRTASGNSDSFTVTSPLFWRLRKLKWLQASAGGAPEPFAPRERWYVPALSEARRAQYSYLQTLPIALNQRLDSDAALAGALKILGMPHYDLQSGGGALRLLGAVDLSRPVRYPDMFQDQMRSAWRATRAEDDTPFPARLIVLNSGGGCAVHAPSAQSPFYLPDSMQLADGVAVSDWPRLIIDVADAQRLAERFEQAYPGAVVRASRLSVEIHRDGVPWDGADAEAVPVALADGLLAVYAHGGAQRYGVESEAFRACDRRLRQARIAWSETFAVVLRREDGIDSEVPPPDGFWSESREVLFVRAPRDVLPEAVAEAFAALLQREDLYSALRLLLIGLDGRVPGDDRELLRRGLARLRIDEQQIEAIRVYRSNDVDLVKRYIRPVLWQLSRSADLARLDAATDRVQVRELLCSAGLAPTGADEVLRHAGGCPEPFDFGRGFCTAPGRGIALPQWNKGLCELGYPLLRNELADDEFRECRDGCEPALRRLLGQTARRRLAAHQPGVGFAAALERLALLTGPVDLDQQCWQVGVAQLISAFVPLWREYGASESDVVSLRQCDDRDALNGIATDYPDPLELAQRNACACQEDGDKLEQIRLAWSLTEPAVLPARLAPPVPEQSDGEGRFLEKLTPQHRWALLRQRRPDGATDGFWQAFDTVQSLDALCRYLGLSESDLTSVQQRLDESRREDARLKRQVDVCGLPFDPNTDDLGCLWVHLQETLTEAYDKVEDLTRRDALGVMKQPRSAASQQGNSSRSAPSGMPRISRQRETLIGLCGEIHAYRFLQSQYDEAAVSPSAWKSENRRYAGFVDGRGDDGYGCDFEICHEGKTYCIEVKASEADASQFTLGSSEVRLAQRLALRGRRDRKRRFRILRVLFALTKSPAFVWLPNPYEERYKDRFRIEAADVRVDYHPHER